MRYMMLISSAEKQDCGAFPPALMDAIQKSAEKQIANKTLVSSGGLLGSKEGTRVEVKKGQVVVTDGPYTEAKEIVGGFAIFEFPSKEVAVANAKAFMELHVVHWPGWQGTCDVRPMMKD
jgi:hypothetical protein